MNALIGFVALIAVGLVGWAIAEFKYKAFTFTRSEKDAAPASLSLRVL